MPEKKNFRRFVLQRNSDVSGVSGTGVVAQGVEFSSGVVALAWQGAWPTSVVFHDRGMDSVQAIHGHSGATQVLWLDEEENQASFVCATCGCPDLDWDVRATTDNVVDAVWAAQVCQECATTNTVLDADGIADALRSMDEEVREHDKALLHLRTTLRDVRRAVDEHESTSDLAATLRDILGSEES